jgi:predicted extracellular nuclease
MTTRATLAAFLLWARIVPCAAAVSDECGAPAIPIHVVQGTGASSPLAGATGIAIEGVVVGDFRGDPGGIDGVFVQEEDADADASARTSEGVFVYAPDLGSDVRAGDTLRVRGEVREFFGLTEIGRLEAWRRCPARGAVSPARVPLPLDEPNAWERVEGMRVRLGDPLVASGAESLGRFGELVLSTGGRLVAPTQAAAPGDPADAWLEQNLRRRVLLDDGRYAALPTPTPYLATASGTALRLGDRVATPIEGVVDFAFGSFRIHPTLPVQIASAAARPAPPAAIPGALRLVAWNVENFFNGDGRGGGFPTRGAANAREYARQRAKIVETLAALDADVIALAEIENDGVAVGSAAHDLATALSLRVGARFEPVDPGAGALGDQAISVGLFYRDDRVTPVGSPAVLDARARPAFDDTRNRPTLARGFAHRATGERLVVAINHWKSKGSDCDGAGDPDLGDGQGNCNRTRTRAANALADWLATDPPRTGGAAALIVGDLNSYPKEDPVTALLSAGFVDLLERFGGPDTYSYVFDGAAGRLDHALASPALAPLVGGAGVWHSNADEPPVFDYREANPPAAFAADPYRASDHDPVVVDLFPDRDGDGRTDARDACPQTTASATVRWGSCDTGVRERLDRDGCTLADRLGAAAGRPDPRARLSAQRRWLLDRFVDRTLSPRETAAILACLRPTLDPRALASFPRRSVESPSGTEDRNGARSRF